MSANAEMEVKTPLQSPGGAVVETYGRALEVGNLVRRPLMRVNNLNLVQNRQSSYDVDQAGGMFVRGDPPHYYEFPMRPPMWQAIYRRMPWPHGEYEMMNMYFAARNDWQFEIYTRCDPFLAAQLENLPIVADGDEGGRATMFENGPTLHYAGLGSNTNDPQHQWNMKFTEMYQPWTIGVLQVVVRKGGVLRACNGICICASKIPFVSWQHIPMTPTEEYALYGWFGGEGLAFCRKGSALSVMNRAIQGCVSFHTRLPGLDGVAGPLWLHHHYLAYDLPVETHVPEAEMQFQAQGENVMILWKGKTQEQLPMEAFRPDAADYNLYMICDRDELWPS